MDEEMPQELMDELNAWLGDPDELEEAMDRATTVREWAQTAIDGLKEDIERAKYG